MMFKLRGVRERKEGTTFLNRLQDWKRVKKVYADDSTLEYTPKPFFGSRGTLRKRGIDKWECDREWREGYELKVFNPYTNFHYNFGKKKHLKWLRVVFTESYNMAVTSVIRNWWSLISQTDTAKEGQQT